MEKITKNTSMVNDFQALQTLVKDYYEFRGYKMPDIGDAAIWLATESAELLDAVMRREAEWVRNNPTAEDKVEFEIADCLMMATVLAFQSGESFKLLHFTPETNPQQKDLKIKAVILNSECACIARTLVADHTLSSQADDLGRTIEALYFVAIYAGFNPVQALINKLTSKGFLKIA